MSTLQLAAATAALTAAFKASAALAGITVTEGGDPAVASNPEFIIVGHDGTLQPDGSLSEITGSGTFTARFIADAQPPLREETGRIPVVALSQTGDAADLPARITEAQRLLAACDDAATDLRSGNIVFDGVTDGRLLTRQVGRGCAAIFAFTVGYSTSW